MQLWYRTITAIALVVTSMISLLSVAQQDISFDRIGLEQGLSENTVFDILQDHKGFMWFATHDGLNKFDGYSTTVFRNIKGDTNSIADNIVYSISQSPATHDLWMGTNVGGLVRFDYSTERFTSYRYDPVNPDSSIRDNIVRSVVIDEDGIIWLGYMLGGISRFDPATGKARHFVYEEDDPWGQGYGEAYLILDSRGYLWSATKKGLFRFDRKTEKFDVFSNGSDDRSLPSELINSLYEDEGYVFWIGTEEGLLRFSPDSNEYDIFTYDENEPGGISSSQVYNAFRDDQGQLWLGTRTGLNIFNEHTGKFSSYFHDPADPGSLSSDNISVIYQDKAGVLWVGTFEYGVNKMDTRKKKFNFYHYNNAIPEGIPQRTVRSIYQDQYGVLWLGFVNGGLFRYDREENDIRQIHCNATPMTNGIFNTVTTITEDHQGALWIGTWANGLVKMTFTGEGRRREISGFTGYPYDEFNINGVCSPMIQFVFEDDANRLWVGTGSGLDLYDHDQDRFLHLTHEPDNVQSLSNYSVQDAIVQENDSVYWLGTWNGLNRITLGPDFDNRMASTSGNINDLVRFDHFFRESTHINSLNDNRVTSLVMDKQHNLWAGLFGGGVSRMAFNADGAISYQHFDEQNGLANNAVYCVLEDNEGNIWVSTNNGLSEIVNPDHTVHTYKLSDGLQGDAFFWGAGAKGIHGELFFGGYNGLNAFFPQDIDENEYSPPIVITEFSTYNKPLLPGGGILKQTISETDEINIAWGVKEFTIEFASLHYSSQKDNKYRYRLTGYDDTWVPADYLHRKATYTNLDPGSYRFEVMATNSDGVWNENPARLIINVIPPFWMTWWFRLLVALVVAGSVYGVYQVRIQQINKQRRVLVKKVEQRTSLINQQKEALEVRNTELVRLNSNKERLMSMLSHDLRSPLSTSITMMDLFLTDWDSFAEEEKKEIINSISKHTNASLRFLDDTLKFLRTNWNEMKVQRSKQSLYVTMQKVLETINEYANNKEISIEVNGDMAVDIETDHDMVAHVLINFISNAIKFSPRSSSVEVRSAITDNVLSLCVTDQGFGIPADKIDGLFDMAESFGRSGTEGEKSIGIGLKMVKQYALMLQAEVTVTSTEKYGSRFCLKLPIS